MPTKGSLADFVCCFSSGRNGIRWFGLLGRSSSGTQLLSLFASDAQTLRPQAASMMQIDRHNGRMNWNFLDGHAEALAVEQTLRLAAGSSLGNFKWEINLHDPKVGKR